MKFNEGCPIYLFLVSMILMPKFWKVEAYKWKKEMVEEFGSLTVNEIKKLLLQYPNLDIVCRHSETVLKNNNN
jgi:hypothetical protein